MVGSSKILTVSYGTFSCTLEGFDDPFSTMRSIAEYFRDLAADDRYFGAEPPTPDADMLHRIAEKEVQRRVEARVQNDGIHLRQVEREQEQAAEVPAPVAGAAAVAAAALDTVSDDVAPEEIVDDVDVPAPETAADVAAEPAPIAAEAHAIPDETVAEAPIEESATDLIEGLYAEDEEIAAEAPAEPVAAGSFAMPASDDNSVAAKLSRIRAVVSGGAHGQPVAQQQDRFAGSIEAAFAEDLAIEDAEFEDVAESGTTVEAEEADFGAWDADEEAPDEDDQDDAELAEYADYGADIAPEAETAAEAPEDEDFEDEAAVEATAGTEYQEYEADEAEAEETPGAFATATGEDADEDEPDGTDLGLAERLVMLKRAARDLAYGTDESAEEPETAGSEIATSLSEGDESDLMADLAEAEREDEDEVDESPYVADFDEDEATETPAAEAELAQEQDEEDTVLAAIARATSEEPADALNEDLEPDAQNDDDAAGTQNRHPGFDTENTEDAAFDRILEQTNSRMDDSEGSRRRSAIAHLKAAVAATKADRLLKRMHPEDEAAEEQSQYRDDLAKVVQPRRPLTQPRDDNPHAQAAETTQRPTPLVLVSEQRVDAEDRHDEEMGEDVHPRRVTTRDVEPVPSEEGFADFAAKMGATELPDLLEAAAAYTAFVEGNKLFSRPQLMRRVAYMESGEEFTREAGLRSFGQLLRQGKIQKLRRGQFTISEETKFNPQARLAGE